MAILLSAGVAAPALAADAAPVRLDVGIATGVDPAAIVATLGADAPQPESVTGLDAFTVDLPADRVAAALATLTKTPGVRYAERSVLVQADSTSSDPMEIPQAQTWTRGSSDLIVAVVDTGVSPTIDLGEDRLVEGYDFVDGDADAADGSGHGTVVAGVIAADVDNGTGAKGVCDECRVMPVRVLGDLGNPKPEGTSADVAAGIVWAADHGARIINLSLSTASPSSLLRDAVAHASGKGALVVGSAGNVSSPAKRYPAAYEPVLAVSFQAAMGQNSVERWVDLTAYAGDRVVIGRDGTRQVAAGSSAATAVVSGIAALAFAMKPSATADEVRGVIKRSAERRSYQKPYDAPFVNAAKTVYSLGGTDTVPPVVSATGFSDTRLYALDGAQATPTVSDDHGIERVEYIVGGKVIAAVPMANWYYWLSPADGFKGTMPVTVRAYDYGGNRAEKTTVLHFDAERPTGAFVEPATTVVHGKVQVVVESPSPDVDFIWGTDQTMTRIPGTNRWKGMVDLSKTMEWSTINVYVRDKVGNQRTVSKTVFVDSEAPSGGVITPAAGKRVRGTFTSTLTDVVDESGVVKTELWANGRYLGTGTSKQVATGGTNGNVKLVWKVTDKFGQSRTLPTRTVIADNKGPSVSITKAPKNKAKVKGTVKVYVKASDASGVARVELLVNGKVVAKDVKAGYVLSVNTKKQKKTMKVRVRAYDKLGNVTYTSTRTWYRR
ncbi:S8 family serine peptidase [Actinoplanes sp. OR16]|uniref:S8 family serine peptidase n=1 Tax=Actinoplanes sp. OR16 TaxID=946334 RepID=UPI000FD726AC|nr:S8 family serine peptidase [Actinoplanes sp. OR16]